VLVIPAMLETEIRFIFFWMKAFLVQIMMNRQKRFPWTTLICLDKDILPNEFQGKVIRGTISLLARVYSPLAALKQMQKMDLHPSATPSWKVFLGSCPSAGCWGSLEIGEVIWTQVGSIQLNLRNFRLDTLFISASETLFQLKILAFIEGPFQL
jgi:hypothetical protein